MKLFGGTASIDLSQKMGKILGISVSDVEQHVFPDGERRVKINNTVVGDSVVVVQSACPPVDTNYMELFFLLDAVKRSGAEFVTAVIPYFGYQRQDHIFRDGESVSLEVVIRILESLKIDSVVSVDMHSSKIPSLFTIPVTHISALPLFAETIRKEHYFAGDSVVISPDTGGIERIKKLAEDVSMEYAVITKDRDLKTGEITMTGIEEGSLTGKKRAIIVDDMISSGKTIAQAAAFLKKHGIEEVVVFVTHPVFAEGAAELLEKSDIAKLYVTDTVVVPKEKQFSKLAILSLAPLLVQAIQK